METLNSILDTLIIYTEAMYLYVLFGCLILHINKWLDKYEQPKPVLALPPCDEEKMVDATPLLTPVKTKPYTHHIHNVVPFTRTTACSPFTTWTVKQLRSYLKDLGYTRLSKLHKQALVNLADVA